MIIILVKYLKISNIREIHILLSTVNYSIKTIIVNLKSNK